ncbi:cytochrome oxidase [Polyangium spumosum]|uniref:Cytochrome oxidase n=1 Tax=Polyangium spumosum TaxID=889282 RepID=A0A6N7PGH6_9BACT|nr:cytochrome oxidase [Polyangium spumosum]MRG91153.1 cytochrome oxidase [Polyangium spumosum]
MDAIYLQIFVSFLLVLGSILLFAYSARQRDDEHADRLALLPIEDEKTNPPSGGKQDHVGSAHPR